jgi:hypothetical protein
MHDTTYNNFILSTDVCVGEEAWNIRLPVNNTGTSTQPAFRQSHKSNKAQHKINSFKKLVKSNRFMYHTTPSSGKVEWPTANTFGRIAVIPPESPYCHRVWWYLIGLDRAKISEIVYFTCLSFQEWSFVKMPLPYENYSSNNSRVQVC